MKTDKKLPLPANEAERLAVLKSYDILDTLPEKDFDAITKLASYICGAPIALISLLDENRQWFKSTVGLEATETARNISFCQYAIMDNTVFEVPDAQKDERFIANPLVTADPNIRFYAGAPLIMPEGLPMGTLCVIDCEPKVLTNEQIEALQTLANEVVSHIILRKQKRNLEKEKARLSEALQVKEQFLANMSHEIRTPMNGILGLTNLLLHTQLNEEQRTFLQHIKNCTDNLTVIINDILEFSKLEAGKVTFEAIPFDISELLDSIVCLHTPKTREKGLFMQTHISADVPRRMVGDPARLAQILHNLIGNAIKFTREGKINVLVACKEQTAENIQLLFTVEDTGIGIAPDKLSLIFESFTQASNDTSRLYGGTGLGLTITKKLVEGQGGNIWVESQLNKGSSFHLMLSFGRQPAAPVKRAIPDQPIMPASKHNIKVLIAEDNEVNQLITVKILTNKGYETELAPNGKIAIEKLQDSKYDVILMDIQMPEMDGYQAISFIRNHIPEKNNIPIIALTAHAIQEEIEKCFRAGADDYLAKPFHAEELISRLENLVMTPRL